MAKRKTTTRRRRRYVSRTSRRTSSRVSGDKMIDDLKFAAAVGTGLILGKSVAGFVDQGTNTVSGMMGIDGTDLKQFIRPVVTAGIGLVTHQMVKHPLIKRVGLGIAAYGVVDGVQKITGQKMLAGPGLGDVPPSYQALPEYQIPVMALTMIRKRLLRKFQRKFRVPGILAIYQRLPVMKSLPDLTETAPSQLLMKTMTWQ
ncbi:hypothetical protein [Marinilabilia salmonicolor]|uniref:hypothetical protein n=1 Tax=Marinilabilia salmonicolor TaxID=989 RepID=UPI0011E06845|nr:hypothetical protein [Marinilabilia salmonicolor]